MPSVAVTVQNIVPGGIDPVLDPVASIDGIHFTSKGGEREFIEVANGGAGPITVTVAPAFGSVKVSDVGTVPVPTIQASVPNGDRRLVGPFSAAYRRADGTVLATFSAVTSVTAGVFRVPAVSQ